VNFLAAKPEPGFYNLEFRVTPDGKNFIPVQSSVHTFKVFGQAAVTDVQLLVSDSQDTQDLAEGRKYKVDYPTSLDHALTVESFQHLLFTFKLKNQGSGKSLLPQQVFVTLSNARDEVILIAKHDGKQYSVSVSFEDVADNFYGGSGEYSLTLTVGDAFVQNPISWKVAALNVNYPAKYKRTIPSSPFVAKPEIVHMFRQPEKRPPKTTSFAFTLAVLSPIVFLLVGFLRVGANISNFPFSGTAFLYAIGFQGCFGSILGLFVLYWLQLNMVQTLLYLTVLSVPTVFFAQKALTNLAVQSKVKTA